MHSAKCTVPGPSLGPLQLVRPNPSPGRLPPLFPRPGSQQGRAPPDRLDDDYPERIRPTPPLNASASSPPTSTNSPLHLGRSLSLHPLARARSPPKPRCRRGPDHRSSSRRVPELPLRRPRRPRASGRAGVPYSGRVKLFPNLGRRRPPRFIPPPLCAPVHSRASVCRAVSLHPLLLPLVPPHTP